MHAIGRVSRLALVVSGLALVPGGAALAQHGTASPFHEGAGPDVVPAAPIQRDMRPNVLIWMLDDVGFGQLSCFGGLVETPNIDRVARAGLRYTNYHTVPICSASRAAMLTGRNPHSVHIGGHATAAREGFLAHDAKIPPEAGTIAANLHGAGYATYALGKWDHLPNEEASPAGPFARWAQGQGFDRFYGFMAADADQWNPVLFRGTTPVMKPTDPAYHVSADLADQAIAMIDERSAPGDPARVRPFFMYWATGAAHAPHHAPKEWIEHYKGRFDMGWDAAREAVLKSQITAGIVPKGTKIAPRPEGMPAWDSLTAEQKKLYARQMEVFAASLSYADAQFGRMLDRLQARGELDNTMIVIASDNGASAEGAPEGLYNEAEVTSASPPSAADNMAFYDDWGGPRTYPHYAVGWAVAGDTPYRYYKQTTHEGGTRVPLVISWPRGIAARGEVRRDFAYVNDIAPTLLEATGTPLAKVINNVPQTPMEGQSIASSFKSPGDPRNGRAQYVELYGNKKLMWQGWSLVTSHRAKTWSWQTAKTFDEPWELYDVVNDPGETRDLAAQAPERVARMAAEFDRQASAHNVFPLFNLSDTGAESVSRLRADFARRGGQWRYDGPVGSLASALAPPVIGRGFRMNATLTDIAPSATGAVFAQGGQMGGIGLYLNKGRPQFILNDLKGGSVSVTADMPLEGKIDLHLDVLRGASGVDGKSDFTVTIRDGERMLAHQVVRFALPPYFGLSEVFGVGSDAGSPVLRDYAAGSPFPGRISEVRFDFR